MKPRILACIALAATAGTAHAQSEVAGYDGRPYCREFTQEVMIGGRKQTSYGTSCLQPDGSWQIAQDSANSLPEDLPPQAIPYSPAYAPVAAPVYYEPYYRRYSPGPFFSVGISSGHYHGGHYRGHRGHGHH